MQFTYRAKQDPRTESSGVIEAVDLTAAILHLKRMGLYPIELVPLEAKEASPRAIPHPLSLSRMELALWARTIGQGLSAGLSLTQALNLLSEQESKRSVGRVTQVLQEQVTGGVGLAEAMEGMGSLFSPVAVSLVRAGEASGALEQVLLALAEQMEQEADLLAKVRGALIYPLFVLTVGIGTIGVLIWVVVPKLALLFAETGQPLPWATRWMIASGGGLLWALGAGLVAVGAALFGLRRGWFKLPLASWVMRGARRLPLFGRLISQAEIARLSSTLGLLLSHGLPLLESLRLAAGTVGGSELKSQLEFIRRDVMEGVALSASFGRRRMQEPFLLTMVAMGEAQGDLGRAFKQASARYCQEVDRWVKVLSTLVEPLMILIVGLIVGGIVFSMLLPIFQLNFTAG